MTEHRRQEQETAGSCAGTIPYSSYNRSKPNLQTPYTNEIALKTTTTIIMIFTSSHQSIPVVQQHRNPIIPPIAQPHSGAILN
jgi:hypothetical protein